MIYAQVLVRPRTSIFDPQGEAVKHAIQSLGLTTVSKANVGKCIELQLDTDDLAQAKASLESICRDLLSNPVIEDFELVLLSDKDKKKVAPSRTKVAKPKTSPRASKPAKAKAKSAPAGGVKAESGAEADKEKKSKKLAKKQEKEAKKAAKKAKKALKKKD